MHTNFPTFTEFFNALWGYDPFPWQTDIAERAVSGDWPDFIAAPTGSGKTACLEVAVYALAAQAHLPPTERKASRRFFFIVNRRVIVDEAFERGRRIATALANADSDRPACKAVADALLSINPTQPDAAGFSRIPLDCVQLRGAIYRDQRWTRSLLQPTIVATTIDQIGSRLLFRGYGVTPNACPIHAALVATDALWLLDEAHISRPFAETVERIQRFRRHHLEHNPEAAQVPDLHWVQLTATPPKGAKAALHLSSADHAHPVLSRRLTASKPARLVVCESKSKAKQTDDLAIRLIEEAVSIIKDAAPRSLAIMVNRVATARLVAEMLIQETKGKKARFKANVTLLIGRMRPIDRDVETQRVQAALKNAARREFTLAAEHDDTGTIEIVVSTQCLEVGADLDFDALVTECASLDALRQRFGRLNRAGRDISAGAAIIMPEHLVEANDAALDKRTQSNDLLDPVYGNALSATWNWLKSTATDDTLDFGISAMKGHTDALSEEQLARLNAPTSNAPIIFPAYLDSWAQTSPFPFPSPDPAPFLHGSQPNRPDVLVVWRADLSHEAKPESLIHDISLCPPSQTEALPVPLHVFRSWFFSYGNKPSTATDTGDLFTEAAAIETNENRSRNPEPRGTAILWRGIKDSHSLERPADIYPGATIVLPHALGGWTQLGQIPNAPVDPFLQTPNKEAPSSPSEVMRVDCAEIAFAMSKDRAVLRLRPELFEGIHGGEAWKRLCEYAVDPEKPMLRSELMTTLTEASTDIQLPERLRQTLGHLVRLRFDESRYADEHGVVLTSRKCLEQSMILEQAEDDLDDWSRTSATEAITLSTHIRHVADLAEITAQALGLQKQFRAALRSAAELHDLGKADPRFQALLLGGNPHAAYALEEPLAKSERKRLSATEHERARLRSGLPKGFRHEMASVQLAEAGTSTPEVNDLVLHFIATHHGYARPFAPVVDDPEPPSIHLTGEEAGHPFSLTTEQRSSLPPHRLDSGIPERFWLLLRQHGPWTLALLETVLRLADQQASEAESEGWYADAEANLQPTFQP